MSWLGKDADLERSRPEDVAWLSSLSHSELDFLISIKKLAIQRAKVIGVEDLGDKFNVKMLRATGIILLEYLKDRLKNSSGFPSPIEVSTIFSRWNPATSKQEGGFDFVVDEDTKQLKSIPLGQKRTRESSCEEEDRDFKRRKPVEPS